MRTRRYNPLAPMSKIDYARGSLDQLAVFVAVARERSFTAAAAKLNVSQSRGSRRC